jgi:hypothetical protein
MDCDTKASILKLRALREKLCTSDAEWKKAFEVRDHVINALNSLQLLLDDEETSKEVCALELRAILKYFEDNNNV